MKIRDCDEIATWLAEAGLLGIRSEGSLVQAFCERCIEAGLPLGKSFVMIDTLHPMHEARAFFWDEDKSIGFQEVEYPSSRDGDGAELWKRSPFLQMLRRRELTLRCRLETGETRGFPAIEELRDAGQTDYLAIVYRIRQAMRVEDVDAFYARWTTARPGGFSEEEVGVLSRLTPHLGLAVRSAAQTRLTKTLVEAYLGQGPGRQVLSGGIRHGSVKRINAVLWFSDITGYTNLSESVQNDQLVPLINDYAEAVIGAVKGAGGDVLKLIGDGVLAMFTSSRPEYACRAAVEAERDMRARLLQLARRRENDGLPVADIHWACMPAGCSTATSARRTVSTSPLSASRSMRSAGSAPCASRPVARCFARPSSPSCCSARSGKSSFQSAGSRCVASAARRSSLPSIPG